jgi:hypothetical protein
MTFCRKLQQLTRLAFLRTMIVLVIRRMMASFPTRVMTMPSMMSMVMMRMRMQVVVVVVVETSMMRVTMKMKTKSTDFSNRKTKSRTSTIARVSKAWTNEMDCS